MKIIVDESLGISSELLKSSEAYVRKTKVPSGGSLDEAIVEKKSKLIKKLKLPAQELMSEYEELLDLFQEAEAIFYIYDAGITNSGIIKRISNWSYPDRKLFLLDGSRNRAFVIFVLAKLKAEPFEEVYQLISRYENQKFTIINDLRYLLPSKYLSVKESKAKKYHLLKGTEQFKVTSGSKDNLMEQLLENIPSEKLIVASREPFKANTDRLEYHQLEKHSLPLSSDKVDIFIPI